MPAPTITVTITITADDYAQIAHLATDATAPIWDEEVLAVTHATTRVARAIVDAATALPEPGDDEHPTELHSAAAHAIITPGDLYAWEPHGDQAALVLVIGIGNNGDEAIVTCKVIASTYGRIPGPLLEPILSIPESRFIESAHLVALVPLLDLAEDRPRFRAGDDYVDLVIGQDLSNARQTCAQFGINPDKAVGARNAPDRLRNMPTGARVHIADPFTSADAYKAILTAIDRRRGATVRDTIVTYLDLQQITTGR